MQDELRWREYRKEFPINTVKSWGQSLMEAAPWTYTGWSGAAKEPLRHWTAFLGHHEPLVNEIWTAINETLKHDGFSLSPSRIIANLFAHGDSSWLHTDSLLGSDWTVIIYLNDFWDLNWGGETVIVEDNEIAHCCAPTPGKVFLFKSNLLHGPRPVSREAPYSRLGLTFQCASNS
jgi:hypothetical protein